MYVYKSLEREPKILGIPITQAGVITCLFLTMTFVGAALGSQMTVSVWYYIGCLSFLITLYLFLRKAAAQNHPSFLLSWIAYHFYQPISITYEFPDQQNTELA